MKGIAKQRAGFKFGKYRTTVLVEYGEIVHRGRKYKLVRVETKDLETEETNEYLAARLYNAKGRFIKQLMIEPCLAPQFAALFSIVPPETGILSGERAS